MKYVAHTERFGGDGPFVRHELEAQSIFDAALKTAEAIRKDPPAGYDTEYDWGSIAIFGPSLFEPHEEISGVYFLVPTDLVVRQHDKDMENAGIVSMEDAYPFIATAKRPEDSLSGS